MTDLPQPAPSPAIQHSQPDSQSDSRPDSRPRFEVRDPEYASRIARLFGEQSLMTTLGGRLTAVAPGVVEAELDHRPGLTQNQGYFHAGTTTSLLDTVCGYAAQTLMAAEDSVLSVEFKVNLLAPGVGDRLVATGRVLRPGRTITVCQGDAFGIAADSTRTQVATMTATMIRVADPDR